MAQVESEDRKNKHESPDNGEGDSGKLKILDRQVVRKQGCFSGVIDYIEGCHPELGKLNGYKKGAHGWQGDETVWEHGVITPSKTFIVEDPKITRL